MEVKHMNHQNENIGDFHKLPTIKELINLIEKSGNTLEQAKKESFMLKVLGGTSFTVNLLYVYSQVLQQLNALNYLELLDLNDDFWSLTLSDTVYISSKNQFCQYQTSSGLYLPIPESALINQLLTKLSLVSRCFRT
jgi:hypothetical protein